MWNLIDAQMALTLRKVRESSSKCVMLLSWQPNTLQADLKRYSMSEKMCKSPCNDKHDFPSLLFHPTAAGIGIPTFQVGRMDTSNYFTGHRFFVGSPFETFCWHW